MILAVDAGNSNLVLGAGEKTWRLATHPMGSAADLRARVQTLLAQEGGRLDDFQDIVLASVVPALTSCWLEAFKQTRVIDHHWPFSFAIHTLVPSQTGIDRLINAETVWRDYGASATASAIIIDSGTATTIDALTPREGFLGGAILPGIEASRDALILKTAQLFKTELTPPTSVIGRDTDSALRSGVVLGYASMIDGMIVRFKNELPGSRVIVTGGLGPLLRRICHELRPESSAIFDSALTLKGIRYLYESFRHR